MDDKLELYMWFFFFEDISKFVLSFILKFEIEIVGLAILAISGNSSGN